MQIPQLNPREYLPCEKAFLLPFYLHSRNMRVTNENGNCDNNEGALALDSMHILNYKFT